MDQNEIGQTLSSIFETLYRPHRLCGKSQKSVENHRVNLRHFSRFLGRDALLSDLTDDNVLGAMQRLLDKGRTPATANKLCFAICAQWRFVARKGLVKIWPDVQSLKVSERSPQAWSEPQIYRLFKALDSIPRANRMAGLPLCDWMVCFHLVLWDTGERLTATLKIRLDDLDIDTGWLILRAENRKGRTRDTRRRLNQDTLIRVRRLIALAPDREFLFPLDCCPATLFNRYRKILKAAGMPHGKESMFHRMRRSAISHFKAAGGDGTRFADHASPETTRKSYEDPTIVIEPQASDFLFRPLKKEEDRPEPPRAA